MAVLILSTLQNYPRIPEYKLSAVAGMKHFKNTRSAAACPAHTACKLLEFPVTVGGGDFMLRELRPHRIM